MHFEVLTEDRSGGIVIETLMRRLLDPTITEYSVTVRPHRGKGDLPVNPYDKPERFASGLMDLLPAKLRAYDRVCAGTDFVLVVVLDSDYLMPDMVHQNLRDLCSQFAPGIRHVIGICVEETEAWLLADQKALLSAYPDANVSVLHNYVQDSVCGTWEVLCHVLLAERANALIRVGYPAIGQYKHEWAQNISRHMDPKRNVSPSFLRFSHELMITATYQMKAGVRS
jgi:hypothetical protein